MELLFGSLQLLSLLNTVQRSLYTLAIHLLKTSCLQYTQDQYMWGRFVCLNTFHYFYIISMTTDAGHKDENTEVNWLEGPPWQPSTKREETKNQTEGVTRYTQRTWGWKQSASLSQLTLSRERECWCRVKQLGKQGNIITQKIIILIVISPYHSTKRQKPLQTFPVVLELCFWFLV